MDSVYFRNLQSFRSEDSHEDQGTDNWPSKKYKMASFDPLTPYKTFLILNLYFIA